VVKSLRDRIGCKIGSDQVGLCADGKSETSRRVVVSTCASILKCDRDCDLLLFDEAHGVGHNEVALNLREFKKARKFGFTATPGGRSDGADLVMEAVFGPVLASIPYAEAEAGGLVVPIEVVTHRVDMGDSPLPGDPVSRKRWRYWRNKDRNKAVADAALSFPEDELVLVMVETLEHAAYLAPMLPGFKVAHAAEGVLKGRSKLIQAAGLELGRGALDEMRKSFARGDIKKIIATMAWKQGIDVPMLTALVRADGSASPITSEQVPGRLSRLSEGKDKGVLVDFIDEGCAWSERRTAARLAVYRKAGWTITEDKDKHGPIDF
jgi:superfamily II DNA or RNA helicase